MSVTAAELNLVGKPICLTGSGLIPYVVSGKKWGGCQSVAW